MLATEQRVDWFPVGTDRDPPWRGEVAVGSQVATLRVWRDRDSYLWLATLGPPFCPDDALSGEEPSRYKAMAAAHEAVFAKLGGAS